MRAHGTRRLMALLSGFLGIATLFAGAGAPAKALYGDEISVGVIVPIVAKAGNGLYLSASELETMTAPDGEWSILSESAQTHGLTVALDTRITASIDALGDLAPRDAIQWRDAVLEMDPLLLPWGNADVWGLNSTEGRTFDAALIGGLSDTNPLDLVVWPSSAVSRASSLSLARELGYSRILLDSSLVPGGIDSTASAGLGGAVSPLASTSPPADAAALASTLVDGSVVALPRNALDISAARFASIVNQWALYGVRFIPVSATSTVATSEPANSGATPETLRTAIAALDSDSVLVESITADPELLLANRIRSLCVLSNDIGAERFTEAATAFIGDSAWLSSALYISLASEYTVLSNAADVPLSVSNNSDALVTVVVKVRATSAIVHVDTPEISVTIEPRSNVRIEFPISTVANGRTMLVASLTTESGAAIGKDVTLPVTVQAEWEAFTLVFFGALVSSILVIGAIRTVRRRRGSS